MQYALAASILAPNPSKMEELFIQQKKFPSVLRRHPKTKTWNGMVISSPTQDTHSKTNTDIFVILEKPPLALRVDLEIRLAPRVRRADHSPFNELIKQEGPERTKNLQDL